MQGVHLRKYGVEAVINFELYEVDGVDFRTDAADAGSDCSIMKDQGAEATCTNDFVDEGKGYSLTITATEMQAAQVTIYVVDSATKVWLDKAIHIETYGHASAMHAIDLDDAVRAGLTALPNAAADAAGGLPLSDAGGLDIDAILADTNELQSLIAASKLPAQVKGMDADVLTASALATDAGDEIADQVADEVYEGALTHRHMMKIIMSVLAGKSSGGGTATIKFRDIGDTKDRVTATVEADGDRTAMTLDGA